MIINDVNNSMIISHPSYSGIYQDNNGKWDLYQGINMFWFGIKAEKNTETIVHVNHEIFNKYKKPAHILLQRGLSVVWLSLKKLKTDRETCTVKWVWNTHQPLN